MSTTKQLIEKVMDVDDYIGCIEILAWRDGTYRLEIMNSHVEDIGVFIEDAPTIEKGLNDLLTSAKRWAGNVD